MARRGAQIDKKREDFDSIWLEDPRTLGLVKAQVEDPVLVRTRRGQFVRSAIKVFCAKSYHAATIKEIAKDAGVSPGLIYQYVNDKEELLFLALQLIVFTLKQGLPEASNRVSNPVMKFYACFEAYCRVIEENRDASILTYRETKSLAKEHINFIKDMELQTNEIIAITVRDCIEQGYFTDVDVELFVYHTIMTAHSWALKYWRLSKVTTIDEYIVANARFLLSSVLTAKGREALDAKLSVLPAH
ncbi:TetR family transcriptional regulator [Rhizobium sp. PP-F2F-G48]|uniref:TetR/AcrR family transcriptional regulator n=1 Tax=Rhizobium sp. PP-F2F-G48 TaxID=2135651 RepID=UPI001053FD09|nr:TetR/AcrR family transcriptional regulator [Rhizobium sp. PP-F2F-G48]TCM44675.1 TetR family transcriptional regulator [Rhizobium sp. PP-F2F-G48]